jgi:hypothetical protein
LGVIGTIAMQAASGAAGSALAGGDPLKGAVIGGLTAGGGQFLGKPIGAALNVPAKAGTAIGTGIGATAGNLVTGQNLKNSLLSGLASGAGSYFIPNIAEELGITLPGTSGSSTYSDASGWTVAPGSNPNIPISSNGGSNLAGDAGADTLGDEIVVSGGRAPPFTPVISTPITLPAGMSPIDAGIIPQPMPLEELPLPEDIIVNAPEPPAINPIPLALPGLQTAPVQQPDLLSDVNPEVPEERSILDTALDVADIATTVVPVVGGIVAGGGGGGGTIPPDTSGITFRRSPLRQTLTSGIGGGAGGIGGTGALYPYTPMTYGRAGGDQETEFLFFTRDPVTGAAAAPAVVPASAPGKKEGGEIEDDMVKHLVEYHKNGGHHGPGQVKGIGSGQDDKIPAWLSDGEYVWSAQDVADLGDGSTDEGVRRLDKMRQMVRQQAGRKDVKKIAKPQKGIDKMLKAVGGLA